MAGIEIGGRLAALVRVVATNQRRELPVEEGAVAATAVMVNRGGDIARRARGAVPASRPPC